MYHVFYGPLAFDDIEWRNGQRNYVTPLQPIKGKFDKMIVLSEIHMFMLLNRRREANLHFIYETVNNKQLRCLTAEIGQWLYGKTVFYSE